MQKRNYSDHELITKLKQEVAREREALVLVLEYLAEVEQRRLYNKYGYSTLWEFVVKELGYDSGSAQRRINAMRVSRDIPEVKQALQTARLSLSTVAMVEQFTKNEKNRDVKRIHVTRRKNS